MGYKTIEVRRRFAIFVLGLLPLLACFAVASAARSVTLEWPMGSPRITQDYACHDCFAPGFHTGIDMTPTSGGVGTPVNAALGGIVYRTFTGSTCATSAPSCGNGFGNYVIVEHQNRLFTVYAHLDSVSAFEGTSVPQGTQVGTMGSTGSVTAAHLHFEVLNYDPGDPGNFNPSNSLQSSGLHGGYTGVHPSLIVNSSGRGHLDPKEFFSSYVVHIDTATLNVRERPTTGPGGNLVSFVNQDQEFVALARTAAPDDWYYIALSSSIGPASNPGVYGQAPYGWVSGDFVTASNADALSGVVVADGVALSGSGLNVRSSPTTGSAVLTKIWDGQPFKGFGTSQVGTGCAGFWHQIYLAAPSSSNATDGWVCDDWVYFKTLPGLVTNPDPPDGGPPLSSQPALFTWSPANQATTYDVYLDGFYQQTVAYAEWSPTSCLPPGIYSWRVDPANALGTLPGTDWILTIGSGAAAAQAGAGSPCVPTFVLDVVKTGSGGGTATSSPSGINCGNDCSEPFLDSTFVTLDVLPDPGSELVGWTGCDEVSGWSCTLTLSSDRTVTAAFGALQYALTTTASPPGAGFFIRSPDQPTYDYGQLVTITASPSTGYVFSGWSGCDSVAGANCTVTMTSERIVTASFVALAYILTTTSSPPSAGSFLRNPDQPTYSHGQVVTTTANASAGYAFSGWSGCDSVAGANCTVTMVSNRSVTATFTSSPSPPQVSLNAQPLVVALGASAALSWTTIDATACVASGDWSGAKPANGIESVSPLVTSTYTLICTGPGGAGSDSASVAVVPPTITFVDANAAGSETGTSWVDAFTDLQVALGVVSPGSEIWVAAGTYRPTGGTDRSASFALRSGVGVYGGFGGFESARDERDPGAHVTILSGDLLDDDGPDFTGYADNSYNVVTGGAVDSTAVLDGFTISGGNANGSSPNNTGGGIRLFNGDAPTFANLVLSANYSNVVGGAMTVASGSSPYLESVDFIDNKAQYQGGAVYSTGSPVLRDVLFLRNDSQDECGGGMTVDAGSARLTNVRFVGNSARLGGGLCALAETSAVNAMFSGNDATDHGGGIYLTGSSVEVSNSTFSGNTAGGLGGGIHAGFGITLDNTILWGNSDSGGFDESAQVHLVSGQPFVSYSIVEGWSGLLGGAGNSGSDPLFVNPAGVDGTVGTEDDSLRLVSGSPGIDAGSNVRVLADLDDLDGDGDIGEPIPHDLDGLSRFANDPGAADVGQGAPPIVDLGAYEVQAPPCSDGIDNDNDGHVDFPDDVGCRDAAWWTESPQCSDGINNDPGQDPNPGLIDFDGGQSIYGSCSGGACPPGVSDPDLDGIADPDPQCGSAWKNRERAGRSCGLGFELAAILPWLVWLSRRRNGRARPEIP